MNRAEWEEYFEAVNGRRPQQQDVDAARAAGEFSIVEQPLSVPLPQPAPQSVAQGGGVYQAHQPSSPYGPTPSGPAPQPEQQGAPAFYAPYSAPAASAPGTRPVAPVPGAAAHDAGTFLRGLWAWTISALKAPFKGRSEQDSQWFGWIAVGLASLLSSLVFATIAWKAISAVSAYASNGFSSLSGLLSPSLYSSGNSYIGSGTSSANGAVTTAFFGAAVGFFAVNMVVVLCIWMVRHAFLGDARFSFLHSLDLVGRQLVPGVAVLLAAEFFALVGVNVLVSLLLIVVAFIEAGIVAFGVFQGENHRAGDGFYLKLAGLLVTDVALVLAVMLLATLGLGTILGAW